MTDLIDLASEAVGGAVLAANDEFFAPASNLVKAHAPGVAGGRLHRPRQVDGRVGEPSAPLAGT